MKNEKLKNINNIMSEIDEPLVTEYELLPFIYKYINENGFTNHNIVEYDRFLDVGINYILSKLFEIDIIVRNTLELNGNMETINIKLNFGNVSILQPTYISPIGSKIINLNISNARTINQSYSVSVYTTATINLIAKYKSGQTKAKKIDIPKFKIGNIPLMVGSKYCYTKQMSKADKLKLNIDPYEPPGYFIIKGGEWAINMCENVKFNVYHLYDGAAKEHVRGEFISQQTNTFHNSSQIIIRYMKTGAITIELNSTTLLNIQIPWYIIFKILDVTSDKDILEKVIYDYNTDDPALRFIKKILEHSLHVNDELFNSVKYNIVKSQLISHLVTVFNSSYNNTNKERLGYIAYLNNKTLDTLDKDFLPHIGTTAKERHIKVIFLGTLINKLLNAHLGAIPKTDRDDYSNKNIYTPGILLAKTFKTIFNTTIMTPILSQIKSELKTTEFNKIQSSDIINIISNNIEKLSGDLTLGMEKSIVSGTKDIKINKKTILNKIVASLFDRKNQTNVISILRNIVIRNISNIQKQSARAIEIRSVHPTLVGYICVVQSADTGEKVGVVKQLAITASVSSSQDIEPLRGLLRNDEDITLADNISDNRMLHIDMVKIYLNGSIIGYCKNAFKMANKYKQYRRDKKIDKFITIYWNLNNELYFWADVGRLLRPVIIVYNNIEEYDEAVKAKKPIQFKQYIKYTKEISKKLVEDELSFNDLVDMNICEYVSVEESKNCFMASSILVLQEDRYNVLKRYTHCDIQQSILGIVALISPFANHTQPVRVCYETNQSKQTCGFYTMAPGNRTDIHKFLQFTTEEPLVKTLTNDFLLPNGMNVIIAYTPGYNGCNQEDSIIVSKSFVESGGFSGIYFTCDKIEIKQNENITIPNSDNTKNLKMSSTYEKLGPSGYVPNGTEVKYGDVVIGKVTSINTKEGIEHIDSSYIYLNPMPAIVEEIYRPNNNFNENIICVKYRYYRPLKAGDKMCLTGDHTVLVHNKGFIPIKHVKVGDSVLTLTKKGKKVMGRVKHTYAYNTSETLYDVDELIISQCMTKTHKLPIIIDGVIKPIKACDLVGKQITLVTPDLRKVRYTFNPTKVHKTTRVYCLTVDNSIFMVRRNNVNSWTGNSNRSGNKGIVAVVMNDCDLPYTEDGIHPDLMINPSSIPTRMTIGQVLESGQAFLNAMEARITDGTAFLPNNAATIIKKLEKYGAKDSKVAMYNGMTGRKYDSDIFMGVIYYQRLQKFVDVDSYGVGNKGPVDPISHQPSDGGKAINSGLKTGEMELWTLLGHGSMGSYIEKIYDDSDGTSTFICRSCGNEAIYNKHKDIYICNVCTHTEICEVDSKYASEVFKKEIGSSGVTLKYGLAPKLKEFNEN